MEAREGRALAAMGWWSAAAAAAFLAWGCAAGPETREGSRTKALAEASKEGPDHFAERRYVDRTLGFEIERPDGEEWAFAEGHEAPEGILIPVVVIHGGTGAQVVVQVAPEVAPPLAFAERLAVGLRSKPGFTTSTPEPTRRGSAFRFMMGDSVLGTVDISSGAGRLYVLLGTWPADAPESVARDVQTIMGSLKTAIYHEARLVQLR